MLVAENRPPRSLNWLHAGPLLFGDWGTSRLYVLGLAFFYAAHASALYLAAMSVIMVGVAWCYTIICRCFQHGGGVYAVARQIHPMLAVFGATLLLCDYIVTASLSLLDGMHYFGIGHNSHVLAVVLCVVAIGGIGLVNWYGARNAGRFALVIAIAAFATSTIIAVMCLPFFKKGLETLSWGHPTVSGWNERWSTLVHIVLALSGVEAVANMTGLMKPPVAKTAKRTIWPVLIEVVVLNLVFGIALSGLPGLDRIEQPDHITHELAQGTQEISEATKAYRDTAVKLIAVESGTALGGPSLGAVMGWISGIVFGLLLLSAANTAIMAIVSVLYSLSQDREIPRPLSKLNYSGVPWIALLFACVVPALLLVIMSDVAALADLYAVGVCGAVTISVLGCVVNRDLPISRRERIGMGFVGGVIFLIEITILITKPHATLFAAFVTGCVLMAWLAVHAHRRATESVPEPDTGWLAQVRAAPPRLDPAKPRIMLAARGQEQSEFAVNLAKQRGAVLFAIYVQRLRLLDYQPGQVPRVEDNAQAQAALGTTVVLARRAGVTVVPIYVTSTDIWSEILDYAITYGCQTLIMGESRRSVFARKVTEDVLGQVRRNLPPGIEFLIRHADEHAKAALRPAEEVPAAHS